VAQTDIDLIAVTYGSNTPLMKALYLLRGLFVHRILLMVLRKRWNVQYGLHPLRDPVAVPFHAKGVPSEQAEWGHPDVAVLFTCLSFYYQGLSLPHLKQSLEMILRSNDPSAEYDRWVHSCTNLPNALREWSAVRIEDDIQIGEIWKHLRFNPWVIDHFLNNFVFPQHAKQFVTKLQASGWDVPLNDARLLDDRKDNAGKALSTGFSGTNDNKTMLPLTIKQDDLPSLSHTNAEVLTYLLQVRNRGYILTAGHDGKRYNEQMLLKTVKQMGIKVLIDAGAQILEKTNLEVVIAWMNEDSNPRAAIYFNDEDKAFVYFRQGQHSIPLLATPFAENTADCLVYLDEAHTRGTDLKLPARTRGALTLGQGQTKDHTVQGK
jgi:hypothetical protein